MEVGNSPPWKPEKSCLRRSFKLPDATGKAAVSVSEHSQQSGCFYVCIVLCPIPLDTPSNARISGCSLAEISGSKPTRDIDDCCECCRSPVRSSPTECGLSECDLETSTMIRPTRAVNLLKVIVFFPWRIWVQDFTTALGVVKPSFEALNSSHRNIADFFF